MALTNPTATKAWAKAVETGVEFVLTTPINGVAALEVASMATDVAPSATLSGPPLFPGGREAANRSNVGSGYIYVRIAPNQPVDSATFVLLTWS